MDLKLCTDVYIISPYTCNKLFFLTIIHGFAALPYCQCKPNGVGLGTRTYFQQRGVTLIRQSKSCDCDPVY